MHTQNKPSQANAVPTFQQAFQLHQQGQLEQAAALYEALLKEQPRHIDALHFSGVLANQQKNSQRAVDLITRALDIDPNNAAAHSNLGLALQALKRFDEALTSYDRALAIKSDNGETYCDRGNTLLALNRFNEALASYERALTIQPNHVNAHWGSSWCYLLLGDLIRGWQEYEWRFRTDDFKNHVRHFSKPLWLGEKTLRGKTILLHSEQGLGDNLQFCRYAKLVADLGARVILEIPKPLLRLLTNLEGVHQLVEKGSVLPAFDFYCPLLSLPLAFKTSLASIPADTPYLFSEPDKVKHWQVLLGEKTKPRIGLVWTGNAAHTNDKCRSLALRELLPLLSLDYQFISLQKELRDADKDTLTQQPLLQHYGEQISDFSDTAALCELMDIIISVDTSVAHLAAAMGKPTWILLPYNNLDWRWLLNRDDSPWYPSARLFRQPKNGDWQSVVEQLKRELIDISAPTPMARLLPVDFDDVETLINEGNELEDENNLEAALACYDRALSLDANYARAYSNRGNVLQLLKRYDEAIASYDRALAIRPEYAEAFYNRGNALQAQGQFDAALASYERSLAIKPEFAMAIVGHGTVLQNLNRFDEALVSYEHALILEPDYADAHWSSSQCYLVLGNLDRGWKEYEWRWKTKNFIPHVRHFPQPLWLGEASLRGKTILLYCEQGLGDTLQFCRYAKQLADVGARVILEAPKLLLPLLRNLEGVDQLIAQGSALPAFDFHCPLLSLPLAFKTRLDSIPANSPYLFSNPDKVKHWQALLGEKTKPRIGLVWSGNTAHINDHNRSLALHELLPLLSLDCQFISLQKELRDADKDTLTQQPLLQHYGEQINDFSDTAALCELMDIVISVDTSVAHLAAAMGKPTWILLPYNPDWRWLLDRNDSPWYPSARLFRQTQHGDWQSVIEQLKRELIDIFAPAQTTQLLPVDSDDVETLINEGNELEDENNLEAALACYDRALSLDANYARAHSNRGNVLQLLKRYDEAIASYDRALAIRPEYAEAFYNRGNALQALNRLDDALASYTHALAIKPDFVIALVACGMVLQRLNRYEELLVNCDQLLAIQPDSVETLINRGNVLQLLNRFDQAISSYEAALALKPDHQFLLGTWLHIKMKLCDWRDFDKNLEQLTTKITQGKKIAMPFPVLSLSSDAEIQQKVARYYVQEKYPRRFLLPQLTKHAHSKIKIGYFSSDFRQHPVALLTAELFERHDKTRFEIIAFSFHLTNKKDDMRLRLEAAFDQFIDVSQQSDEQIVQLARELELDIAVDLNGFTENCRTTLFAMRVAPIQVSYIGYLGTMGADYMDYLLADTTLIPKEHQAHYDEKIAYLPHSFQVNDSTLRIADNVVTRAECGLPEQGVVFCCFNNNYKITPAVFASWMRLLQHVEGSVLWLLDENEVATNNLRSEAIARGISADRLIFAQRVAMPTHLARHRVADLFLDTAPYNAGATASAALWAGLPVLTCLGDTFSSRMAASLLYAIGLPELVTTTPADYEALAIQLATHPEQLAAIKQKLADNRLTYPLFNTALFTQHIESAYQTMFDRYQAGLAPEHIYVPAQIDTVTLSPVIELQPSQATIDTFQQALNLHQQGQLAEAEISYTQVLQARPQHVDALHFLGVLKSQTGQPQLAVDLIQQSIDLYPNNAAAHSNIGFALQALNRFDEALASYDRSLMLNPDDTEALFNRGNLLLAQKHFELALASYTRALTINPHYVEVLCNRGITLQSLKRFDDAIADYEQALVIKPDFSDVLTNRGNALRNLKRLNEALSSYDRALVIAPNDVETLTNRGIILGELKRFDEAVESHNRALFIVPNDTKALYHRGGALQELKRGNEALISYQQALTADPEYDFLFGTWLSLKMKLCDWHEFDKNIHHLEKKIILGKKVSAPFFVLAFSSSAMMQQKASYCYVQERHPSHYLLPPLIKQTHSKIKVGYFSADFHNHATAYLMIELFERHDRSQFEIIAFSLNPISHKDEMRLRLETTFDQFIDVSEQSDEQIVRLARELEIDIAVDLKGFTEGCRIDIFAMRVAPIQVNYLGYPGTMGADYIDYLLADSILIPTEYQLHYSEKIAYLPNSYQVNDTNRIIANTLFTRAELGLPKQGFVFCCFNNNYKITPAVFAIWMRLLHKIEGSVLWLLEDNAIAANNLRREAIARGINAERLIFAKRMTLPDHLARHRLADLFLDTLPYNAHTTTSDALWAGLPVLTCMGEAFASRVAASLLNAIGLPELITTNLEDYEALAIKLATHSEQLAALKQKLADNRLTYPLFDTALFTQHIESAYQSMFDRYQAGLAPDYIYVSEHTDTATLSPIIEAQQPSQSSPVNEAQFQQAVEWHQQGQLDQAEALYKTLLQALPNHADALHLLGVIAKQRGQETIAIDLIGQSLAINPNNADAHSNIGLAFQALKRFDDALASYNRALTIQPDYAEALFNRGITLQNLKRLNDALADYDRAFILQPHHAETSFNRGVALQDLKRLDDALVSYNRALAIQPDYAEAFFNRGNVLTSLKRLEEATASYQRAFTIKPDLEFLHGTWLHSKMNVCDWSDFDQQFNQLCTRITRGKKAATPFVLQAMSSSPSLLKKAADCYTQTKYPTVFLSPPLVKHAHSKIKIGYFSSDFRQHPVAHLTAELFERHDKTRFEIIAFSFHVTSTKDDTRLRLEAAFDQFIDVSQQSNEQIVQLARDLQLDIAVDLNGFTEGCRTHIFAMRAAPIQVSYIGYLGTMGADYMDYLLADPTLIPKEHQAHYDEKIAYLPHSFQVNDSTLRIANNDVTRAEFGLPEQDFVFCCFNANFKITPVVFDSWMRILHHVKGSVLWLLEENKVAAKNLRREAIARGISAERLIFAQRLPMPEYLARHRIADLFLDTAPYNAGATASAALWAGLPVLTCLGDTFSSRMAASLLYAIGLPELVTTTPADYETLAIKLATHPKQLAVIKQKLANNRLTYPLFDTALFTQHIESAYQIMFDRYQADLAPEHIYVSALTSDTTKTTIVKKPPKPAKPQSLFGKIAQKPAQLFAGMNVFSKRKTKHVTPAQADIAKLAQAQQFYQLGQLEIAAILYEELLITQPEHTEALSCLDAIKKQRRRMQISPAPKVNTAGESKNTPQLAINTEAVEALINDGNDLEDLGRLDEALTHYDKALAINPDYARAHSNRGNVLQLLKRYDEALASYDRALAIRPEYAEAFFNRGNTLQACDRFQEAIASYDCALAIKPEFVDALISRGNALQDCRRFSEALTSYDHALAIQPNHAEALSNRGGALNALKRPDEALASYERAIAIQPNCIKALIGRSDILRDLNRINDAIMSYGQALAIQPDYEFLFGFWLNTKIDICEWENLEQHLHTIAKNIEQGKKIAVPFAVLAMSSSAAVQKRAAEIYVQEKHPSYPLLPALKKHTHSKIKIGYFSADFRHHATAYLMIELFERHDRAQFEIIAFSLNSVSHKDEMRLRLEATFDQFIDVSNQSDMQVVELARQLEIDIAIDLKGFTKDYRANIFAMRVAPIQVNYLGYPSTMGADYIDYLLADSILIPTEYQLHYSEKIAYLPNSYQVNDTNRIIANTLFTRAELGLPKQGFVFCCFNNNYKITPAVFDSWMRLLHKVENSVLWLLEDNAIAANNLRREATARGINSERLIFAKRMTLPDHLARHRLADLFLDTLPYNAHTTTSDALWAGLPVLTCMGEAFASRVAASLLNAIGLPELITTNLEDYEALAIKLATHSEQLAALKQKLADNRLTYPLFDTALFTQHIESAYQTMFDRHQANLAPDYIYVQADTVISTINHTVVGDL